MKKFRTVGAVIIMVLAGIIGFYLGNAMDGSGAWGGAILCAMIAGFGCVIYNMENPEQ